MGQERYSKWGRGTREQAECPLEGGRGCYLCRADGEGQAESRSETEPGPVGDLPRRPGFPCALVSSVEVNFTLAIRGPQTGHRTFPGWKSPVLTSTVSRRPACVPPLARGG